MQFILKTESFTNKWIEYFSKNTNQNIIFLLDYGAYFQVSVYKEKVLTTDKLSKDITLELKGLDLSKVWDNLIIDIFNIKSSVSIHKKMRKIFSVEFYDFFRSLP